MRLRREVYAKAGGWRQGRMIHRRAEPRYFWVVVEIYGGLKLALMTVF